METRTITPAEALEAVDRLKIDIAHHKKHNEFGQWCAVAPDYKWELGWGDSSLEAVANLLERIAKTAETSEVANA